MKLLKIKQEYPCVLCFKLFGEDKKLGKHYANEHHQNDLKALGLHP
jgi:hypothetical protein